VKKYEVSETIEHKEDGEDLDDFENVEEMVFDSDSSPQRLISESSPEHDYHIKPTKTESHTEKIEKSESKPSNINIDEEVNGEDMTSNVTSNVKMQKTDSKNKRNKYKNFLPRSKEEYETEEVGPDKIDPNDFLHKKRHTHEYEDIIEKEKVSKIIGKNRMEAISKPLTLKLAKKSSEFRSKSHEKKKKRSKKNRRKKKRRNSINKELCKESGKDLRRNHYKEKG